MIFFYGHNASLFVSKNRPVAGWEQRDGYNFEILKRKEDSFC